MIGYEGKKGLRLQSVICRCSFTFGVKAVNAGIPVWITILISVANVTSAGQFAGVAIMAAHGSYLEMAMTTFIINVRYMLMSVFFIAESGQEDDFTPAADDWLWYYG